MQFKSHLGKDFTNPPGAPDLVQYGLIDMYTKCTEPDIKESIVSEFCTEGGTLRIIIATIALGMGLDCPDVRQIIHWGAAKDVQSFVQETGRGGRDGQLVCSLLF